ncbi:hydantoinase/oxoprolinase family protein [Nocardioides acrostichi]|uniref:Hydantoinase/oxoprolinase family protein n=1 Tax=Nocardioides acrostichi TaxID=2784339 RepID=A0A930V260_9ACTN|nr:hydantoinase/oxoprolinase family protein [Nocardioides acrostichi]MBF4163285.1 hydantoinase/oxoprolinase family protein [Nocardioides acrostichi]
MVYVLGIDVGGTFTDAVAADLDGNLYSAKAPSTPPDFGQGVLDSIDALSASMGVSTAELLGQTSYIAHGTTSTLNALVTGAVATTGFITTKGHRDAIFIMNIEGRYAGKGAEEIQAVKRTRKPKALVPKRQVKEAVERIDLNGSVVVTLDEEALRADVRDLLEQGVTSIAVSLLWSFRNPSHEHRVREIIEEMAPEVFVVLSSDISPRIREYPRSVTTLLNAQVGPMLRDYLAPLQAELENRGLEGPLLIMQGSGGTIAAAEAPKVAITTIGSVLTGGVAGARKLGSQLGHENIISTDIGGTTFLVGMVVDGEPVMESSTVLDQYRISTPMAKVATIGSGGGAIASLDANNNLHVGPRSAGAKPGPACFGMGGEEPTVTDANLVLGILNPDYFLGGAKTLDVEKARAAIATHIGDPLGLSVEDAAAAIFEIQNAQTADLVRTEVVGAGFDPRDFMIYAFGGSGPIHCAAYGRDLRSQGILVPLGPTSSTFSAYGLANADVLVTAERSDPMALPADPARLTKHLQELEAEVREQLEAQGLTYKEIRTSREADVRYTAQIWEVPTPIPDGELTEESVRGIVDAFEDRYSTLYGSGTGFADAGVQAITYRVYGVGVLPYKPDLPQAAEAQSHSPEVKTHRRAMLDARAGWQQVAVYAYTALAAGHVLEGPAIIEAPSTTVVVPGGATATVDRLGNVVITYREEKNHGVPGSGL